MRLVEKTVSMLNYRCGLIALIKLNIYIFPETEPFDESLDVSIHGMADERYTWDKTLATHRRNGPRRLEQVMIQLIDLQRSSTYRIPEDEPSPPQTEKQKRESLLKHWIWEMTNWLILVCS